MIYIYKQYTYYMAKLISVKSIDQNDHDGIEAYVRRNFHRTVVSLPLIRRYQSPPEGCIRAFMYQLKKGQIDLTKVTRAWP